MTAVHEQIVVGVMAESRLSLGGAGFSETLGKGYILSSRLKNCLLLRIWTSSTRTRKCILVKKRRKYFWRS